MEEPCTLPPHQPHKSVSRLRTASLDVSHESSSPTLSHSDSSLRRRLLSRTGSGPNEIYAPRPQRHLLDKSTSPLWLHTPPPLSPASSRATSPSISSRFGSTHYDSTSTSPSASIRHQNHYPEVASPPPFRLAGSHSRHARRHHVDAGMGRQWIGWMHQTGLKTLVVPAAILTSFLVKLCLGIGSYSGMAAPPMYGDYEAQRHWMELTIHLPVWQWYVYDLQYWGLDYPPLTAYVSWMCGTIGSWIEPSWFALGTSRGLETEGSKLFMRSSVIAMDMLVYLPALLMFIQTFHGSRSRRSQSMSLLILLFQPALLLIDHGHFQYNSVMLGLTLFSLNFFATGHDLCGAACFVLSLGFKQMSLYYAPAFGCYLLARCVSLGRKQGISHFLQLSGVTTLTFLLLFLPFLPPFASFSAFLHVIKRIFPFARGLFEDKVANFWCASNVLFKWKNSVATHNLVKLSTLLTVFGFLLTVVNLLRAGYESQLKEPISSDVDHSKVATARFFPLLPYALLTSSLSFFLFSFQVHEKTILVPLLPLTLILSGAPLDSSVFSWGVLMNNTAVFSMWPLVKRDGLGLPYMVTLALWNRMVGYNPLRLPFKHASFSIGVYSAMFLLHLSEFFISPPTRYPDLYAVLNVLISTPVFLLTWLWSIKSGIEVKWALGSLGTRTGERRYYERRDCVSLESVPAEKGVQNFRTRNRAVSLGYFGLTSK